MRLLRCNLFSLPNFHRPIYRNHIYNLLVHYYYYYYYYYYTESLKSI